jgi:ketosteroid isomerase-like protein
MPKTTAAKKAQQREILARLDRVIERLERYVEKQAVEGDKKARCA